MNMPRKINLENNLNIKEIKSASKKYQGCLTDDEDFWNDCKV
jgi:hypothetical protein